jgi:hypothetical protein
LAYSYDPPLGPRNLFITSALWDASFLGRHRSPMASLAAAGAMVNPSHPGLVWSCTLPSNWMVCLIDMQEKHEYRLILT